MIQSHRMFAGMYHSSLRKILNGSKETKNNMLDPFASTKLAPWLSNGCLSVRRVFEALRRVESTRGASASTYWLRGQSGLVSLMIKAYNADNEYTYGKPTGKPKRSTHCGSTSMFVSRRVWIVARLTFLVFCLPDMIFPLVGRSYLVIFQET